KVNHLIQHLSSREKSRSPQVPLKIPTINETYQASSQVTEIVRQLVERKLALNLPSRTGSSFSFSHVAWMKEEDLMTLFWDLGLEEIRKAFYGVEPHTLKTFLVRFSPTEAKEIRGRIDRGGIVSPEERREAQQHVISLPFDQINSSHSATD